MAKDTEIQLQMQQSQERIRRRKMQIKKNLTLYMNGKRIGKVAEASFELDSEEEKLGLIIGIKVTNNWLKTHGGIMTRKFRRRKRG